MLGKSEYRRIEAEIRTVLANVWNPIGIVGLPADEYDGYVGRIYGLLTRSSDNELARELLRIEREDLGLSHAGSTINETVIALRAIRLPRSSDAQNAHSS